MGGGRSHGLDFAVRGAQFFQGAATEQLPIRPGGPDRDPRQAQSVDVERMHTLPRRYLVHLRHIMAEARARSYARLSLETGSRAAFEPARRLYESFGFQY